MKCPKWKKGSKATTRTCMIGGRMVTFHANKTNKAAKAARMKRLRKKFSCKQNKSTGLWRCGKRK